MEYTYILNLKVKIESEQRLDNKQVRAKLSEKITFPSVIEIDGQQLQLTFVDIED